MRLLEVVAGAEDAARGASRRSAAFADHRLGKSVVRCKDTPGLRRQPDRLVLDAGGVLRGVRDGPAGRGGGPGARPPARHPQDRDLRPRRPGRHRPSAARRREPARRAAAGRPVPRGRPRVPADHAADRDRLHRAQGQGRLLSPRTGRTGSGSRRRSTSRPARITRPRKPRLEASMRPRTAARARCSRPTSRRRATPGG